MTKESSSILQKRISSNFGNPFSGMKIKGVGGFIWFLVAGLPKKISVALRKMRMAWENIAFKDGVDTGWSFVNIFYEDCL